MMNYKLVLGSCQVKDTKGHVLVTGFNANFIFNHLQRGRESSESIYNRNMKCKTFFWEQKAFGEAMARQGGARATADTLSCVALLLQH